MNYRRLIIAILVFLLLPIAVANGQFSINNPSVSKIKEAADYATDTFEDPWDMSNAQDLWSNYSNMKNASFANGIFSASSTSNDPVLYFLWGGYPGSVAAPRDGVKKSIDTSKYKNVSLKMYSSVDGIAQLYWFYNQDITIDRESVNFHIYKGWHIYNLSTHEDTDGTWSKKWTGKPMGVRLDPANSPGADFSIDWLKISSVDASSKIDLNWIDDGVDALQYKVYAGVDGSDEKGALLGAASASSRNLDVNLSSLLAGDYNIYVNKVLSSTTTSRSTNGASVNINSSPTVIITEPDLAGGKDWASETIGNSWDMSNSSDIFSTHSVTSKTFQNGYFTGVNKSISGSAIDDPFVFLNQRGKKINADKYHRLSIRYKYDGPFDLVRGTMARAGWRNYPKNKSWQHTDDILTYSGWTTLTYDLKNVALDVGNYGWRDYISDFRFDPHEDYLSRRFYIDDIRLSEDDVALNGRFDIKYSVSDVNDSSINLVLKADPDLDPLNGNESLLANMIVGNGAGVYTWMPNENFNGTFNIFAQVGDGTNSQYSYSSGPVFVDTYRPKVFTKKAKAIRKNNKKKEINYFKRYKSTEKRYKAAKRASDRKKLAVLVKKHKKAYIVAKKKIANAKISWLVHDLHGDNTANVTIVLKKKYKSKAAATKAARYKNHILMLKKKLRITKSLATKSRYAKLVKSSSKKLSKVKVYSYKTVKKIKYNSTFINQWKKYSWKTSSAGTYIYYVYATDSVGNTQQNVSGSSLVVK